MSDTIDQVKALLGERNAKRRRHWVWGVTASLIVVLAMWALDKATVTMEKVSKIDSVLVSVERRLGSIEGSLEKVEIWERNWERYGELPIDVKQNTRLDDVERRLDRIER